MKLDEQFKYRTSWTSWHHYGVVASIRAAATIKSCS